MVAGDAALIHGNRNRMPKHRIGDDIRADVLRLFREKYYDFNFSHFTDLLNERRVGGNICERIVSAWNDWKHPNALQFPLVITSEKITPNDVTPKPKAKSKPTGKKRANKKGQ